MAQVWGQNMFGNGPVLSVGEAMVELAPVGDGLYRRGFAGDTFNTIWHLAQLVERQAGFVSRVGSDGVSDAFVTELAADGLDVAGIGRDAERVMGLYLIELDGAERSFQYWRESSAARLLADDPQVLARMFDGAALIHLSGITLAILSPSARKRLLDVLAQARARGTRVSFDPNIRPRLWSSLDETREAIAAMLTQTDIALPSFDDEAMTWGDASPDDTAARLLQAGVEEFAIKTGDQPVLWRSGSTEGTLATPPVSSLRDTTGAGDAFNAGYLAARLAGNSPTEAVAMGQALAGQVIGHFGARLPKDALAEFARQLSSES